MRVVGCFLGFDDKFVVLFRHSHKPEGNTWALPGGKVEPGETDAQELQLLGEYEFKTSENLQYQYVIFSVKLSKPHHVKLEEGAHSEYKWLSPDECYARTDLIRDLHNLLKLVGYIK
ncbi:MAG TPA: NUDIX hydrolase [Verrucomicrobiae bacterium]|nr:NUDIX hydrolase [Verrucomicrobiae bacterium]